jgi:hypothetical protein
MAVLAGAGASAAPERMSAMAVSSVRALETGSGTVSTTSGSKSIVFVNDQGFKEGASVVVDPDASPQYFTIDSGSGKNWTAMQNATATVSGKAFKRSKDGSANADRARGGSYSYIIPNAAHFVYRSVLDSSGNPDLYLYFDTLFPENGVHPYLKDQYAGITMPSSKTAQALIPDALTRLRIIEGVLRGSAGSVVDPMNLIKDLLNRLTALETWANGPGHFGTPPAVGANPSPTISDLLSYGDSV